MRAARWPRERLAERLLWIDPRAGTVADRTVAELPSLVRPGDLLVVNDAATLPGALPARGGLEVRLAGALADGRFRAVLFGAGDWRVPTEKRPAPPRLTIGDRLFFGNGHGNGNGNGHGNGNGNANANDLSATVDEISAISPRLVTLRFDRDGARFWEALYRLGRPVQYSYLAGPLELWHVQTRLAGRPWAAEAPSATRPLAWESLAALARRGVAVAALTHAAGLSSTGDPALDAALPLPERYEVPAATVAAVEATRARGGRVVAAGTSVVRALEGCHAAHGHLVAGAGETALTIGPATRRAVVDGLFTGLHEPAASHFALLQAFVAPDLLGRAYAHAEAAGYLGHEFGDSNLILDA